MNIHEEKLDELLDTINGVLIDLDENQKDNNEDFIYEDGYLEGYFDALRFAWRKLGIPEPKFNVTANRYIR